MIKLLETSRAALLQNSLPAPSEDRIMAAIDVGTNSIHMAVVKVQPAIPSFTIIAREKSTVRLGDREKETGSLTLEAMQRAYDALKRCREVAQSLQAEEIVAVATSAVREAPNGRDFLRSIERDLGISIDLISGPEEARRIYLGVLSGMEFNGLPHVVIDIGGGSTELILGDGQEPRTLSSTKIGAVRLSADYVSSDPITPEELSCLQAYVRGMLERPIEELQAHLQPGEVPRLVGTSGTIETLAMLHSREKFGVAPTPLNGYQMSYKDLKDIVSRLRKMTYAERSALPGMSDRRAEIIVPGAVILLETMALLGLEQITICERALREGVVVDWMLAHGLIEDRLRFHSSVRQRSVIKIAHKYHVNLTHAEQVAKLALSLFDQTQGILHDWGPEEREMLWAGAILHNCGHFISHSAHHKHSYYLIRNGELLGFNELEIETIANLARYHRKSPPKKKHESYRNIVSKRHRQAVDQLSAMLRLAVALDRRQIGAVKQIQSQFFPLTRTVNLHLVSSDPSDDCALELWNLDYKKEPFELVFGVKLKAFLNQ